MSRISHAHLKKYNVFLLNNTITLIYLHIKSTVLIHEERIDLGVS